MNRTNSQRLFERARKIFPGGVNSPVRAFKAVGGEPFIVKSGQGAYLLDADGNRYVDYVLSWGPLVLGHAHPAVVQAITEQARKGTSYGACCELEAQLAEIIMRHMPNIEMLRFVNSGTEAAMTVLRLARGFTGRNKIIKFAGCYHGHADALLVQAGSGVLTLGLPGSAGVPEEATRDTLGAQFNDRGSVEALFARFPEEIAAIIVEPVIGNSGLIPPVPGFLEALRDLATRHGALLIFDEVMTGFRVHPGGAQTLFSIKPDLTMLGKVIGGGLPVGAVGGRRDIMEHLAPAGPIYQAGTLSGNPLAMAAGAAALSLWLEEREFDAAQGVAEELVRKLAGFAEENSIPLTATAVGTMFGFFFTGQPVRSYSDLPACNLDHFNRFFQSALAHGVYFAPSQFEAGFVSSVHPGEPLERTLDAVQQALKEIVA